MHDEAGYMETALAEMRNKVRVGNTFSEQFQLEKKNRSGLYSTFMASNF